MSVSYIHINRHKLIFIKVIVLTAFFTVFSTKIWSQTQSNTEQLFYELSWNPKSDLLKVDLKYSSQKDSTVFTYGAPAYGDHKEIFKILGNIHAATGDSIRIIENERKIVLYHSDKNVHKLHYEIDGKLIVGLKKVRANELFRPVINAGSLYVPGYNLFLNTEEKEYKQLSFVWKDISEDMPYFLSTSPKAKPCQVQSISQDSIDKVLAVMGRDLLITTHYVYGIPYYLIGSKRDTVNNLQLQTEPFFKRFFPSTRDFWKDYKDEYYFICLLPFFNEVPSGETGFSLGKGFVMKYSGPLETKKRILAHETSHTYIGVKLTMLQTGMENNWFNEGFNDYAAIYNLVKSGIMSKAEFVEFVNDKNLKAHYTSPVNSVSGTTIEKNFWTDINYQVLNYQRGFIYAFYLDNKIRLASDGQKNIRDFLLAFFNQAKETGFKKQTLADFIRAASKFVPEQEISSDVGEYLINGKPIDFHDKKLIDVFVIEYVDNIPVLRLSDAADLKNIYNWK